MSEIFMSDKEWWEKPYTEADWERFILSEDEMAKKVMAEIKEAENNKDQQVMRNLGAVVLGFYNRNLTYLDENREVMHLKHIQEMEYASNIRRKLLLNIINAAKIIGINGAFIPAVIREDLEKYR